MGTLREDGKWLRHTAAFGTAWETSRFTPPSLSPSTHKAFSVLLISWALIVREVALYVTRILFSEKLANIEQIRPWTNSHGYFMHLTLILGLLQMYSEIHGLSFQIHPYMQLSACASLALGVISIFQFLRLE